MTAAASPQGQHRQQQQKQQSTTTKPIKRLYIGNLRPKPNLKEELYVLLGQSGIAIDQESIQILNPKSNKCAALIPCRNIPHAISCLHGNQHDGRRLVVQREKKQNNTANNNRRSNTKGNKKSSFGSGGWAKPPPTSPAVSQQQQDQEQSGMNNTSTVNHDSKNNKELRNNPNNTDDHDDWDVSEMIGNIVSNEIQNAQENPSEGDELNAVLASTAAATLLASLNAFGVESSPIIADNSTTLDVGNSSKEEDQKESVVVVDDFRSMCQKPLSALLADYGEQDKEWKKVVPTEIVGEDTETPKPSIAAKEEEEEKFSSFQSMLSPEGKAPIHVELVSFGYIHGIPSEIRSGGWTYAHPLSPTDTRHLPEVPHYLARQDGKSPMVKRALLYASDASNHDGSDDEDEVVQEDESGNITTNRLKICANRMARQVASSLQQAIDEGGYGHASPLRMAVHVGSDTGRHRSVVVCELAAVSLRSILRMNVGNKLTQPISVGTRHRDIERNRHEHKDKDGDNNSGSYNHQKARSKQKELESDW